MHVLFNYHIYIHLILVIFEITSYRLCSDSVVISDRGNGDIALNRPTFALAFCHAV